MKTVKIIYTGTCADGVVVGETLCKPGEPVDVPEDAARNLLARPDFKAEDTKPKAKKQET